MSSLTIVLALTTAAAALFPFILPSVTHPAQSLTLWDATSTHRTLWYMFLVAIVFLPIILGYTFWVFRVLKGKILESDLHNQSEAY